MPRRKKSSEPKPGPQVRPGTNMALLYEAIRQDSILDIELHIRYDPYLIYNTAFDPAIMDLSWENYFLLKWQWSILDISCRFLRYSFSISYGEFCKRLHEQVLEEFPREVPLELTLKISGDGTARLSGFVAEPRLDLLSGIVGHPGEVEYELYMDTHYTPPSVYTTFPVLDGNPILRAQKRLDAIRRKLCHDVDDYLDGEYIRRDIIMINPNMEVIGGTEVGVAFFRNSRWVTPEVLSGCRFDAMRELMMKNKFLRQDTIMARDIKEGEEVLVFNGVIGVARAQIMNFAENFMVVPKKRKDRPINRARARQRQMSEARKREDEEKAQYNSEQALKMEPPVKKSTKRQKRALPGSSVFRF